MDLLIPNSWLKKYLDTKAKPSDIAKYLSLCGPSIERTKKTIDGDYIYNVEVTTNRVDTASVFGIAREAATILPRFGIKAKLKENKDTHKNKYSFTKKVKYLDVSLDHKLCPRFSAVLIKDVTIKDSPKDLIKSLEKVGVRPINNIVDVSNYIMHDLGQPVHTFDYDKIKKQKMILRESVKGEKLTTLDGKELKLNQGDIVIEDGEGRLIDLCGIMGGENSAIDQTTKNVLLFVQNYDKHRIRKTSMSLAQRSEAAALFEKGLDSENVKPAILSAIYMIEELSGGKAESEILDLYPKPYKDKSVSTTTDVINRIIGISIDKKDIKNYLESLGFGVNFNKEKLTVNVPSYRGEDIDIPEDVAEEIARIYGYHNLPCILMEGPLPKPRLNPEFEIEKKIKETLTSLGAIEVLNMSLVSKEMAGTQAIRLQNALGQDTEYLRTSLKNSLINDLKNNPQEKGSLHFFEIANIYLSRKNDLPIEKLMLSGIIRGSNYRKNKGIVETLLKILELDYTVKTEDGQDFQPNQRTVVEPLIGEYGNLELKVASFENEPVFYYSFDIDRIIKAKKLVKKYQDVSKYPPQVEDLTLKVPEKTYIGDVIKSIENTSSLISKVLLKDIYKNNYTFNIEYLDFEKTLTDSEVIKIREKILTSLKSKFGISL